jgi:hypothetical protein
MDYSNIVIITEPNITALYVGQLISEKSLPALLEENCVTIHDIEFIPYSKNLHEKYIEISKAIYSKEAKIKYSKVF